MFYVTLARERIQRMQRKYEGAKEATGSRRMAAFFVLMFIRQRAGYLWWHIRARGRMSEVRRGLTTKPDRQNIAVTVKITGGIGDYIIAARFLRDFAASVEPFTFDLYCNNPQIADWVFASVPGFGKSYSEFMFDDLMSEYDLALWISHFVVLYSETARWLKLRAYPRLCVALQSGMQFRRKIDDLIFRHPAMDNSLARRVVLMDLNRMNLAHAMLKISPGDDALNLTTDDDVLVSFGLRNKQYVTIHNGFDSNVVVLGKASTKCYPHFADIVFQIKLALPDLPIVQIGANNSITIKGVDHDLVGRTTLPQVAGLLKGAAWHIDVESGLVHMARCFGTLSTVIFGPTPVAYFGYAENQNIKPATCGDCWWITETWMSHCPRGFTAPPCTSQDPKVVAKQVIEAIQGRISADPCMLIGDAQRRIAQEGQSRGASPVPQPLTFASSAADLSGLPVFAGHPDQAFGHISYAQSGEDMVIVNIFAVLGIKYPSYLDVGSHHPINISNTALLYARGSRGINIEANPHLMKAFHELRPEDINLNVGIGGVAGERDLYLVDDWSGRNSFRLDVMEAFVKANPRFQIRGTINVPVVPLDQVVAEHLNGEWPDLLSIDVEGLDFDVLAASHFGNGRPVVICAEVISGADTDDSASLVGLLRDRGYVPYCRTVGNIIFVHTSAYQTLLLSSCQAQAGNGGPAIQRC